MNEPIFIGGGVVIVVTAFLSMLVWAIGRAEEREERREAEQRRREAQQRYQADVPVLGGPELRRRAEESRGHPGGYGSYRGPW